MKTKIVTDHCRKCGDKKRMCGQKASPDEFQIFSVLTGLFSFSALVGILLDSNYAKIIFEKQEQSAFAYAVKK